MSRDGFGAAPAAATPTLPSPAEAAVAFEALLPEIRALRPEEIRRVTANVPFAVTVALGAEPRVAALRDAIVAQTPGTPIACVDRLREHIYAAYYAHLVALPAPKTESEKKALLEEASPLRKDLLVAAEALAAKQLVDAALVAKIRSGTGRIDAAGDLIALSALFASAWAHIEDKTAITADEVERAGTLGMQLLVALTSDARPAAQEATPGELRARAFTLLVRCYDECRRAIAYVRHHEGDANEIAPSLFVRAAKAKKAPAPAAS